MINLYSLSACLSDNVFMGKDNLLLSSLKEEIHPSFNKNLLIDKLTAGSHKKVWWLGKCGHEWEAAIYNRTKGNGCPYCAGNKVLKNYNDLETTNPNIAVEWHPTKNNNLTAQQVTPHSNKKVWWLGKCGHEWEAAIYNRTKGNGCPICNGKITLVGTNDLQFLKPDLVKEWHTVKNLPLTPQSVTLNSNTKIWWICEKNHEWYQPLYSRAKGKKCPICSGKKLNNSKLDMLISNTEIFQTVHPYLNKNIDLSKVSLGSSIKMWWLCEKRHEWETPVYVRQRSGCPRCSNRVSKSEKEILAFLKDFDINYITNNRSIITPLELDIYIPKKNIAIEFNGLYWHSEKFKSKRYHYDKWKQCKDKGIQLIQIWEDEWNRNPEQVKSMLAHKLGVSNQQKVFARKTVVKEIIKQEAEVFLNINHIQGYASGSYYLGLIDKNETLVSVLVLKKEPGTNGKTLNIIRYATSANVIGGFTRLLKYAEKTYTPESFITFSDNCVSNGGLYENNGFIVDKVLSPDYMYVINSKREHKFGYRLKRFKNDNNLVYKEGLTEKQLAELNNLPRIWDAGKIRWVRKLS
jgi:hypothetical protein